MRLRIRTPRRQKPLHGDRRPSRAANGHPIASHRFAKSAFTHKSKLDTKPSAPTGSTEVDLPARWGELPAADLPLEGLRPRRQTTQDEPRRDRVSAPVLPACVTEGLRQDSPLRILVQSAPSLSIEHLPPVAGIEHAGAADRLKLQRKPVHMALSALRRRDGRHAQTHRGRSIAVQLLRFLVTPRPLMSNDVPNARHRTRVPSHRRIPFTRLGRPRWDRHSAKLSTFREASAKIPTPSSGRRCAPRYQKRH